MVRDDYNITVDLLYNDRDPRLLGWLQNTEARAGALGLWRDQGAQCGQRHRLPGAGVPSTSPVPSRPRRPPRSLLQHGRGVLPPEELFAAGEGQDVVYLFPFKSTKADWGFLAISQPLVAGLEQEAYFTWSALFSEALYQRELLRSLSQRSEELAISYQREKEMARPYVRANSAMRSPPRPPMTAFGTGTSTSGTIYLSPRLQEMLGVRKSCHSDADHWLDNVHADDRAGLLAEMSLLRGRGKARP